MFRWRFTFTLKYFSVKTDTIVLFIHTTKWHCIDCVPSKQTSERMNFLIRSKAGKSVRFKKHKASKPLPTMLMLFEFYMLDFDDNLSLTNSHTDSILLYISHQLFHSFSFVLYGINLTKMWLSTKFISRSANSL